MINIPFWHQHQVKIYLKLFHYRNIPKNRFYIGDRPSQSYYVICVAKNSNSQNKLLCGSNNSSSFFPWHPWTDSELHQYLEISVGCPVFICIPLDVEGINVTYHFVSHQILNTRPIFAYQILNDSRYDIARMKLNLFIPINIHIINIWAL